MQQCDKCGGILEKRENTLVCKQCGSVVPQNEPTPATNTLPPRAITINPFLKFTFTCEKCGRDLDASVLENRLSCCFCENIVEMEPLSDQELQSLQDETIEKITDLWTKIKERKEFLQKGRWEKGPCSEIEINRITGKVKIIDAVYPFSAIKGAERTERSQDEIIKGRRNRPRYQERTNHLGVTVDLDGFKRDIPLLWMDVKTQGLFYWYYDDKVDKVLKELKKLSTTRVSSYEERLASDAILKELEDNYKLACTALEEVKSKSGVKF